MNIAIYVVDRPGVTKARIQRLYEQAFLRLIRSAGHVSQALVYLEPTHRSPAIDRPRMKVLLEDATRGGFSIVVVSDLRDFGHDPTGQRAVIDALTKAGVMVEVMPFRPRSQDHSAQNFS